MKSDKIGFGLFLITIGVVWTLMSLGILSWHSFDSIYKLWPLLLVTLGINFMFRNNSIVKAVTWILLLCVLISYGIFAGNLKKETGDTSATGHVLYEKLAETRNGELNVSMGGAKIDIDSTDKNLLEGDINGSEISKSIHYTNGNETAVINIERERYFLPNPDKINNECSLHLNGDVLWNMNYKVGASEGSIDLSSIKVSNLKIDAGAGKFDITFGDKYQSENVKINAGASSFDLNIPKGTGVKVKMNGALCSNNFSNLGWQKNDGTYTSPDYNNSSNKIDIDVHMGVGKINVNLL